MSTVPSGTRFIGISDRVNLTERKSAGLNSDTQPYTIDDLVDTIGVGAEGPQGVEGPAGPPGPVGPAGLEWQGTWVSGTSYVADDAVGYDGASWFCILATSGTTAPDVDTTHWALLASQGAVGPQGAQGPTGPQGAGATQTLQQTVDLGNSITNGTLTTTLSASSIVVGKLSTTNGVTISNSQLLYNKGTRTQIIQFPSTLNGTRLINIPDESGVIALKNYKSYVALVSQSGTSDPTATVVFNDTGATFTWNYDDVGSYFASCSSPILLSGKTVVFVTTQGNPGNAQDKIFGGTRSNDSTVSLFTSSNGILNLNLEIRVYN